MQQRLGAPALAAQILGQRVELCAARQVPESADANADRIDRPTAEHSQDAIAEVTKCQRPVDLGGMHAGNAHYIVEAEEVRGGQEHHVEEVALEPFAGVVQAAQRPNLGMHFDLENRLQRVDDAHLVGGRADAADACDEVGQFAHVAAAQG